MNLVANNRDLDLFHKFNNQNVTAPSSTETLENHFNCKDSRDKQSSINNVPYGKTGNTKLTAKSSAYEHPIDFDGSSVLESSAYSQQSSFHNNTKSQELKIIEKYSNSIIEKCSNSIINTNKTKENMTKPKPKPKSSIKTIETKKKTEICRNFYHSGVCKFGDNVCLSLL